MTTKRDAIRAKAEALGLKTAEGAGWGQIRITTADGRLLVGCGLDYAPGWLEGYRVAMEEAKRSIRPRCRNPACQDGFVFRRDDDGNLLDSAPCDMC